MQRVIVILVTRTVTSQGVAILSPWEMLSPVVLKVGGLGQEHEAL